MMILFATMGIIPAENAEKFALAIMGEYIPWKRIVLKTCETSEKFRELQNENPGVIAKIYVYSGDSIDMGGDLLEIYDIRYRAVESADGHRLVLHESGLLRNFLSDISLEM